MSEWNITTTLTDSEINLLFEIFAFPIPNQFTVRGGLIGLGKSRYLIANQDELKDALLGYVTDLPESQQERVKGLIQEWVIISTKIVKYESAERVKFRTSAPEEERYLIKRRLQSYIPIYTQQEVDAIFETGEEGNSGNMINRG